MKILCMREFTEQFLLLIYIQLPTACILYACMDYTTHRTQTTSMLWFRKRWKIKNILQFYCLLYTAFHLKKKFVILIIFFESSLDEYLLRTMH